MKFFLILLISILLSMNIFGQKELLQSGPMVGYSEMHEVLLWVQTNASSQVKIKYWLQNNDSLTFWTNEITTDMETAFVAKLLADSVKHSSIYNYNLYINNQKVDLDYETSFQTQTIWSWRIEPPDFKFAAGSGAYISEEEFDRPGNPYGGDYQIYENILLQNPDFMLWLGDNVYLRQNEWNTWTGLIYRYTHDRCLTQLQALLASVHNYAIIDDHDFGPDDSDGSFWNKDMTEEAFKLFWANPSQYVSGLKSATTQFTWNDVDFFLLDNRYYRSPDNRTTGEKTQLGSEQLEWLKNAFNYSEASFKFIVIGGQFLNTAKNFETYSNYGFEKERNEIIEFIYDEDIKNVIFLTGDRHHTELDILEKKGKPVIYDLTLSPLTSGKAVYEKIEKNKNRIDSTFLIQRNFGLMEFTGTFDDRNMKITVFDSNGIELWNKIIEKQD